MPQAYSNPRRVMDYATAEHFYAWLETVHEADQHQVEQDIHELLRDHPGLVETHSWPEIRRMAERNREHGIG